MSVDGGFGEAFFQGLYQTPKAVLLGLCTGVFGTVLCIHSTDVADADGVGVVALAVRPRLFGGPALLDGTIKEDDIMVATAVPVVFSVPAINVLDCEMLAFLGRAAMDDYFGNFTYHVLVGIYKGETTENCKNCKIYTMDSTTGFPRSVCLRMRW